MQTCKPGYEIISLQSENAVVLVLKNGDTIQEEEIAEVLVRKDRFT